ncbi:MAG: CHAT domain-containing protein [Pseudomonadota bacterium]
MSETAPGPVSPLAHAGVLLRLTQDPHASIGDSQVGPSWRADTYILSGARGVGSVETVVQVGPADVVELIMNDGTSLLAASDDLPRYLGQPGNGHNGHNGKRRGADVARLARASDADHAVDDADSAADAAIAARTILVGQALRPGGPPLPATGGRDGAAAWMLKALRVYRAGAAGMTALAAAGAFQDRQLEHRLGLYRCATERWELTAVTALAPAAEPILLLIHGSASSTEGTFRGLWNGGLAARLAAQYGNRIYGFEHRTLTDSPIANALALARLLPPGAVLHLLTHSRGGLVGELLARAQRSDSRAAADLTAVEGAAGDNNVGVDPFNAHDIARFSAQAARTGRLGHEADAALLVQLNLELKQRAPRIERFVRVGCPARGTTLASGRLDRWASVMFNLLGHGLQLAGSVLPALKPVAEVYDIGSAFLLAVVQQRCDARILPGIEAMMPDSPLVALLNAADVRIGASLHVLAADCSAHGLLKWLGECTAEVFYGGQTDLVVNTASMAGGAARLPALRQALLSGPQARHLNYFDRAESAELILAALAGDERQFTTLEGARYGAIARGAPRKRRGEGPIVLLLPGIMGSHLHIGAQRVWFDPVNLTEGQIERMAAGQPHIARGGWIEQYHEPLAQFLGQTQEVRPFSYDWRLSLREAGAAFAPLLEQAMDDAERRAKPLRIVAHSSGGLVARLALAPHWARFTAMPGSRLLQLATPNRGTHAMACLLLGRDDLVQMLAGWMGWKHGRRQLLGLIRDFPGVLEMLPWPLADGRASDGNDYFDGATWAGWAGGDPRSSLDDGWQAPTACALAAARATAALIEQAPLDPEHTSYVAGYAETPVAVRLQDGRIAIAYGHDGDGRVGWEGAIPKGVRAWYVRAAHGDLLTRADAFPAYQQLLETGRTNLLPDSAPAPRGRMPQFRAAPDGARPLYPSADEVLAAAMGAARAPLVATRAAAGAVTLEMVHGSVSASDVPVMLGSYAYESLRGSLAFLDRLLDGRLQQVYLLGRFPQRPDEALVVLQARRGRRPLGAIVIGMGAVGELTPGELTRAFAGGLLEYATSHEQLADGGAPGPAGDGADGRWRLRVASLLSGSGYGGLSIALCMRSLIDALGLTNRRLQDAGLRSRIVHLTLYEQSEARAIGAADAIERIGREARYQNAIAFDGRIGRGAGGYRRTLPALSGDSGWRRVHIVAADTSGALRFTLVTDRAHNSVDEEPAQRQAVDGLIMDATDNTTDQPGLSRALYELMLPTGLKAAIPEMRGLLLTLDQSAAIYPWELMRDEADREENPLSTRIGMVRQLASLRERPRAISPASNSVLVVGDTDSGLAELPAAQTEAQDVARIFNANGYRVVDLYRPKAQQVLVHLFDESYFAIHLAGHGEVEGPSSPHTGLVLGPKTRLTAAQISKLKQVPQFVFINCCHLGDMRPDASAPWSKLAANLATAFIEMGAKAVIAAGWRVDDQAASTFAHSFYQEMLGGEVFGDAVRLAREATYLMYPASNTWGAYQAYGDDGYRFPNTESKPWRAPDYHYDGQLLADLDTLHARIAGADAARKKTIQERLLGMEEAARARFYGQAEIREKMAMIRADLGGIDNTLRAIEHGRAAQGAADGQLTLHALETLAQMEIRQGAALLGLESGAERPALAQPEQGEALMRSGRERLDLLVALAPTAERLALRGVYWKLRARLARQRGQPVEEALEAMTDNYRRALEESTSRSGSADYETIFNALAGAFLLKAAGRGVAWQDMHPSLARLLHGAVANAQRRYIEARRLIDVSVEMQAALIGALWASYDGPPYAAVFDQVERQKIVGLYQDALRRYGAIGEPDAVTLPLRFLLEMLPLDPASGSIEAGLRAAMQALLAQLPAPA